MLPSLYKVRQMSVLWRLQGCRVVRTMNGNRQNTTHVGYCSVVAITERYGKERTVIDGTYNLIVRTPLGARKGVANLSDKDGVLTATVTVKGRSQHATGTADGDAFAFVGKAKSPVGMLDYRINGHVDGDDITAVCSTSKGEFPINGKRA